MNGNIFTIGAVGGIISSPPLVGNIFSISILLFPTLFFHNKDHHKIIADYKDAVRAIAVGKIIISGAMIAYAHRDGDLSYKGEDQKCFKDKLEIPCLDKDKVNNVILGEFLLIDAMIDLSFKGAMSEYFLF